MNKLQTLIARVNAGLVPLTARSAAAARSWAACQSCSVKSWACPFAASS